MIDLDPLLEPLPDPPPAGPDLAYDPDFLALEQAAAGRAETQWAPAVPPDWPVVLEQALALARRTRDLRVAVAVLRGAARVHGLAGAADGLALVRGLLERLWDGVHPQLDADDDHDPTMRMNALAPLAAADAALADLRAAALAPARGSLTVRDLELALGRAEPAAGETAPTEAGARQALAALVAAHPAAAQRAASACADVRAIRELLRDRGAGDAAPELAPLQALLDLVNTAVGVAAGRTAAGAATAPGASTDPPAADPAGGTAVATGAIRNRSDAVRELERVCEWIERNEPSHPAPLLLRRAQRLMDKSFLEIVRDLAPDGLAQVERIAGTEA